MSLLAAILVENHRLEVAHDTKNTHIRKALLAVIRREHSNHPVNGSEFSVIPFCTE